MELLTIGIVSYLMGSIPFGLILTKIFLKKDIREIGSGNIGATNALRTGNKFIGYSTLILDIIKAVIPVLYIKINFSDLIYLSALCAFLGHVFPVWLKFKGGKGVAVFIGILLAYNIFIGIVFLFVWLIIAFLFKFSSLAALSACSSVLMILLLTNDSQLLTFSIIITIIFLKHKSNIFRLFSGNEAKINLKKKI